MLLASPPLAWAQNEVSNPAELPWAIQWQKDTTSFLKVSLSGGYSLNTNSITSDDISEFSYAHGLTELRKQKLLSSLHANNIIGFGADQCLTLTFKHTVKRHYILGLKNKNLVSFGFNHQLPTLALNGNKMFAGSTVNLGPSSFTNILYQQLSLGISQEIGKGTWGLGFSVLNGMSLKQLSLPKANLFTEAEGQYIDFDTEGDFQFSDNRKNSNGLGVSTSMSYQYLGKKNSIVIQANDFGFIHWQQLNSYQANKNYHFEGIGIADIFNFNESVFSDINTSSLTSVLGIQAESKNKPLLIPATLSVDYVHQKQKIGLGAGFKQMFFIAYTPKVYLRTSYPLSQQWWTAITVSHGGFGGYDYEIGVGGKVFPKTAFSINAHYAEWLLAPNNTSGQGINIAIAQLF